MSRAVADLPDDLRADLEGRNLIVFDGECVLCSTFYRFVTRFDRTHIFAFAMAQSPLGQRLYYAMDLPTEDFETNLVIHNGKVHTHLDSFAATMRALGWPWRAAAIPGWLPVRIKTPLYALIARNRYRLFGRYDSCMIPDATARARFIDGGF